MIPLMKNREVAKVIFGQSLSIRIPKFSLWTVGRAKTGQSPKCVARYFFVLYSQPIFCPFDDFLEKESFRHFYYLCDCENYL